MSYFVAASLTVAYTRFDGGVAFIWGATAILLADLVVRPRSEWPLPLAMCFVAGGAATACFGLGIVASLPFAVVNVAEAALGALLLRRFVSHCCHFESLPEIIAFFAIVGLAVPSLLGGAAGLIVHVITSGPILSNWLHFATGHALGAVTFTPLLMLARGGDVAGWTRKARPADGMEAVILALLVGSATLIVFSQTWLPLLFLPFLPMMVAVFRLGRLGAAASIVILTVLAIAATLDGTGPIGLIAGDDGLKAQFLQFYLTVAVLTILPAAAELRRRKQLFNSLQEASALSRLILDRTGDIIMRLDVDGTIRYVSPSLLAIAGYRPEDMLGQLPHTMIHEEDVPEVVRVHRLALAAPNDTFIVEYRARRGDGSLGWFETHTRATIDEQGTPTGVVSILREITRRKELENALTKDSLTDPLTSLANRRAFDLALDRQIAFTDKEQRAGCLAMFDLDHFKSVNDRFGHVSGDAVLRAFSNLLQSTLRTSDLVARYGGEEFVAILDGATVEQAELVCERVRANFAAAACRAEDGRVIRATVSVGIASITPGTTADQLLRIADQALYDAKANGRNRLVLAA
ncbi:sensor domain-containing diguanylate cyclase [Sphingomonas echinoides]|uniref:diguanylate cyclase n=1 Tax=Sphingomonas echinoides TaxID=59803 RepID=A0ABU4PJS5_9SPHN|nr:diguanylate cyclase [Sphingomonas echinoides]MDX5983694.1 diguanylate cyclase [Sphingomonas echinoides]